jgi:hypothetical protein
MFSKIGLIGAPRSGKSLIGKYFVQEKEFRALAFADLIKKDFFANSQYSEKEFEVAKKFDPDLERQIRKELWKYSDEKRKKFGDLYFIAPIVYEVDTYDGNIIVTDIRTQEEFCALEKVGIKFVVVVRDIFPNKENGVQGTRISYNKVSDKPVFWNYFNDKETLYNHCEDIFNLIRGYNG